MSKQKEWQRFTELRDSGVSKPDGGELFMYQHGLHLFGLMMLLLVALAHTRMTKEYKRRKAFTESVEVLGNDYN